MKHDLTTRAQVVALKNAGHSQHEAAGVIGKPLSFVKRWWNRNDLLDHHAGGKPVKITRSLISEVRRRIKKKTRTSSRLVARQMGISHTTVLKAAHLDGLRPYHRAKKLILSQKQQKDRLQWARGNRKQDWHKVLFSDEKIVYCVPHTNSKNDVVWASRGDIIPPALHDRHSAKLNVCAAVWEDGRSEIYIFKENLASPLYINILQNIIIKEGKQIPGGNWKLLFDGDPKHTSKLTTTFLDTNRISVIRPPAKSPDLNIIENVWSMLIQEMQQLGPQTAKTLEKSIKKAWSKIPQNSIQNCVLSMPTRLNLVMKSKGAAIKY